MISIACARPERCSGPLAQACCIFFFYYLYGSFIKGNCPFDLIVLFLFVFFFDGGANCCLATPCSIVRFHKRKLVLESYL